MSFVTDAAFGVVASGVFLAVYAGHLESVRNSRDEAGMASQIRSLDEAMELYVKDQYANLRRCAGVETLDDGGVTREIDIPVWSIPAMLDQDLNPGADERYTPSFLLSNYAGDTPDFSANYYINTDVRKRPLSDGHFTQTDCVHKIDHNSDGDLDDPGENYPLSLEETGLLPLWLSVTAENPDRYGNSADPADLGVLDGRDTSRAGRFRVVEAEARGRFGLLVRPIFRFVDGDPVANSWIPVIQVMAGVMQIPSLDGSDPVTTQRGLSGVSVRSGSSGVGVLARGNDDLVIGAGDSWRLRVSGDPEVWASPLLCYRLVHPRPSIQMQRAGAHCETDGSAPAASAFEDEAEDFYPHAAGRGDEFTAASMVVLHTISDTAFLDNSLSRVATGVPASNVMETDINLNGFGLTNVAYITSPDSDGDGIPDVPMVFVGPPSDRRAAADRIHQPITVVGDVHITGELTVGDGLRVTDLGRPANIADPLRLDGRVASLQDQFHPDPQPVTYAELDVAAPRITEDVLLNHGVIDINTDLSDPGYGEGFLPMAGIPAVQLIGGVHAGGEITGVGGIRVAGPRIGLVAETNFAGLNPSPGTPHGLEQTWEDFNEYDHSEDQVIAGNFRLADGTRDPVYHPGEQAEDNYLRALKSVDHYRGNARLGFQTGQVRIYGDRATKLVGGGDSGVTIWSPEGDTRLISGQHVRSEPTGGTPRTHVAAGNIILHPVTQLGTHQEINAGQVQTTTFAEQDYLSRGAVLLDPDTVMLVNDDDASVNVRGRGRNADEIWLLAEDADSDSALWGRDTRTNLQYVGDTDQWANNFGGQDWERQIFPGTGLYPATRYAVRDPNTGGAGDLFPAVDGPGRPRTSRFEGALLTTELGGSGGGSTIRVEEVNNIQRQNIAARGGIVGRLAGPGTGTVGVIQEARDPDHAVNDPDATVEEIAAFTFTRSLTTGGGQGLPVLNQNRVWDGTTNTETCPGGGTADFQIVPTSWRQPNYVEARNVQTLALNLGVGGSVAAPEYAGTSAINMEFTTVLPYLGWSVDSTTGQDASSYGDPTGTDADIPDDGTAETSFSILWFCR